MSIDPLRRSLEADATALRAQIAKAPNRQEERKILRQLRLLERQLEAMPEAKPLTDAHKARIKTDIRAQIQQQKANWKLREEALESGNDPYRGVRAREERLEKIEKGRKEVIAKQRAGTGDNTHKRIKAEIDYLIKSYTPTNDHKIDALIDKWRRSGDPSYDPMIKVRFRNAKKKKSSSDYAL